jgi:Domain of Unknown Function (DUF1206)
VRSFEHVLAGTARGAVSGDARRETEQAEDSRPFRWLVRAGFVARAATYGIIGGLALALALGAGTDGAAPNQQGALSLIARGLVGRAALVVISAGLLGYALWKLTQGILGRGPEGGGGPGLTDRAANLAGGLVYLGFFVVAIRVLAGSAGDSSRQPMRDTAGVLGWPGGQLIVGIAGGALVAISLYQLYDAVRGEFANDSKTQEMGREVRRLFIWLGHVGLTARAFVFALVGYFLVRAAVAYSPASAVGVDGALARLRHQTLGPAILGVVAAGLIIFAAYSLLEARYRRL